MQRPDLTTLTCINPDCQRFRLTGERSYWFGDRDKLNNASKGP